MCVRSGRTEMERQFRTIAQSKSKRIIFDRCNPESKERRYWLDIITSTSTATASAANQKQEKVSTAIIYCAADSKVCVSRMMERTDHPTISQSHAVTNGAQIIASFEERLQVPSDTESDGYTKVYTVRDPSEVADLLLRVFGITTPAAATTKQPSAKAKSKSVAAAAASASGEPPRKQRKLSASAAAAAATAPAREDDDQDDQAGGEGEDSDDSDGEGEDGEGEGEDDGEGELSSVDENESIDSIFEKLKQQKSEQKKKAAADAKAGGKGKSAAAGAAGGAAPPPATTDMSDDLGFFDSNDRGSRKRTNDGLRIFNVDELKLSNNLKGGGTKDCPFDCSCCF